MGGLKKFGDFEISQGADGEPIELMRLPDEFVFLAFDTRFQRLVEFHVLKEAWKPEIDLFARRSTCERAALAVQNRNRSCLPVLKCGEEDGVIYYSSQLNEGEPLATYLARRGTLPTPTVFGLVLALLGDLIAMRGNSPLFSLIRLNGVCISLVEETFLQLVIVNYGLGQQDLVETPEERESRFVHETCLVLFHMLTGKEFEGDDCDSFSVLTSLPTGIRTFMRSTLAAGSAGDATLEKIRDEVRHALMAQTRGMQGLNSKRHLIASDQMLPQHDLRDALVDTSQLHRLLSGRFVFDDVPQGRDPFVLTGINSKSKTLVNIQLLPPRRVLVSHQSRPVSPNVWRIKSDEHPNILQAQSVWENSAFIFVTEEKQQGFVLSRILADRVCLNVTEVLMLLKQVANAMDQAQYCEISQLDLHPCNLILRLEREIPVREMDKLLQKRLDVWPKFDLMLRSHFSMRGLREPSLLDSSHVGYDPISLGYDEFLNRSFFALAAHLLSGEAPVSLETSFPESVPEEIVLMLKKELDCSPLEEVNLPSKFLMAFEKCVAPVEEVRTFHTTFVTAPVPETSVRVSDSGEVLESMGMVSDFDEDFDDSYFSESEGTNGVHHDDYGTELDLKSRPKNIIKRLFGGMIKGTP